jgi:VanZ family protein
VSSLARLIATLMRPWPSLGAWVVVVFAGSSVPMPEGPPIDFPVPPDKIAHGLAYALMSALAVRALWRPGRPPWRVAAAVLGVIVFGALIEGWQALLGTRGCELADGIANAIGAAVGGGLAVGAYLEHGGRTGIGRTQAGHGEGQRRETD